MSNFGGVEILEIIYGIEDEVVWRYYDKEIGVSKIECDYEGEFFFMVGETKILLSECMRVG